MRLSINQATLAAAALAALTLPAALPANAAAPAHPAAPTAEALGGLPEPSSAGAARTELAHLTVAAPHAMTGYSRTKFPHWIIQHGQCDTREVVLARDGQDVKQDEKCRAISGTWYSHYDGKTTNSAHQFDIDHIVPLANAWRSGADTWGTATRKRFANDLTRPQLLAVSASSNRAKGDQSPDQWAPPRHAYWCTYSRAWIDVKSAYHLNVTAPEKAKLGEMLGTCDR